MTVKCTTLLQNGLETLFPKTWEGGVMEWNVDGSKTSGEKQGRAQYSTLLQRLAAECKNKELFFADATQPEAGVRPGILVLVDDVDIELVLEGSEDSDAGGQGDVRDFELQDGMNIVFISTLHGG